MNLALEKTVHLFLRPGADCDSDHELLIAKFRLKLKTVEKTLDHSGMTEIKSLMTIPWK